MERLSKFDYGAFYSWDERYFAVSRQRYTEAEARELFARETDCKEEFFEAEIAAVRWRAGIDEDGEPRVCWWLELDHDGTEPRYCPVWLFEY